LVFDVRVATQYTYGGLATTYGKEIFPEVDVGLRKFA